jgi:hypothetical protein
MADQDTRQLEHPPDLQQFARMLVDYIVSVENIEKIAKGQEPMLVRVAEIVLGTVIGVIGTIGAEFAKAIVNAEDIAEPAFRRLANTALKDITGIDANIDNRGGGRDGRAGTARNIGSGILQALSGISGGGGGGGGELAPSTKAAEDYLSFVVQMSLEGWLTGLMGEMMTLGQVENLGDLDDALANSLGLARTSRAVMRPFIDTTVATPARWQMNKLYRPELLSPAMAVKMLHRGVWSREKTFEELARQGFREDQIEGLISDGQRRPTLAMVFNALKYGYIDEGAVKDFLVDDGYPADVADFMLEMVDIESIAKFQQDLADAAAAAYVARRITPARFNQLLSDTDLPTKDRARLRELAELKRAVNTRPLSEADAEAAAKRKVISIPEYRQALIALGFDDNAIHVKELLLQGDINSAEQKARADAERAAQLAAEKEQREREAAERKARLEAERAVTEPSIGMVERFVVRGHWTFAQYEEFLRAEKYDAVTIAALLADAELARVEYLERQEEREEAERRSATRAIGLAQLETAIIRGHATMADYRQRLAADKYTADDIAKLVAVLQDRIDERAELEERRRRADERSADKGLSVAQFEEAVLRGVATLADFDAFLRAQGYSDFDRSVIVQLATRKVEDQAQALARREAIEAAAAARRVPVADIRRAVLAGVRPVADYRNALIEARVDADDRVLLEELLQADIKARQSAEERRREIERERAERGLSFAQLERAVVAGAATVPQYQQELKDDGYDAESIDTLTVLLLERIQETQRARRRRDELDERDRGKAITPAHVARAVRVGIRTTTDYFNALIANGDSEADAQLLTQLLELEIAEATDARARRTAIADELAGESVSLAQLAADVRAGRSPLQAYGQALAARNYSPADVSTAVALLEREIDDADAAAAALEEGTAGDKVKQLSVTQFEKAVLEGARTITEYVTFLEGQGFGLAAQSSLVSLLLQRLDKNAGAAP